MSKAQSLAIPVYQKKERWGKYNCKTNAIYEATDKHYTLE